eukprot:scaffold113901_cov24-Phaeocystis_antarctica.AAC.1
MRLRHRLLRTWPAGYHPVGAPRLVPGGGVITSGERRGVCRGCGGRFRRVRPLGYPSRRARPGWG